MFIKSVITLTTSLFLCAHAMADPIEVRLASHVSTLSPLHQQSQMFAEEINKRLPGQFIFKIYPAGQLGSEKSLITNLKADAIEMINVASGVMKLDKKLGIFDLPWLFDNREHVQRSMAGPLGEAVEQQIEEKAGVEVIGIYENGFRHVLNSVKSVSEPRDFRGLKIRVSGGKFRQNVFRKMGAMPQSVSWKETFTALQTKVVDGVEAATYGFYEQKQYEVASYFSLTGHVYTPSFLMASNGFWQSLSKEQQAVFAEVGKSITANAYQKAALLENTYLDEMKNARISKTEKLVQVNQVNLAAFKEATQSTYDDYIKRHGNQWLDWIQAARQ